MPRSPREMFVRGKGDRTATDLAAARSRIEELEAELARVSSRDPISTELVAAHAFRSRFELDVQRAHRYGRPLCVALIDIDRFRDFNLEHGYGAGDLLLGAVGAAIARSARAHDIACRIGGDEFAVLFPETERSGAFDAVQRLLGSLKDFEAAGVRGHSASAGVASLAPGHTPEALLACAASALEQARAQGGGRAALYVASDGDGLGEERIGELPGLHGDVIAALASALGERDRYTGEHSESVVDLACEVAVALGLPPERIGRLRTAALLHDIGKVGVPDEVLHKPGPLDADEWQAMRQHPLIGERIIGAIPALRRVAAIVRSEHERWDGLGYPDGLAGEEIPLESRIILACDAFHAMTSDRPYRRARDEAAAIDELRAGAGTQLDPDVVATLVGCLGGRRESGLTAV